MAQQEKDHGAALGSASAGSSASDGAHPTTSDGGCGYQGYEFGAGRYPDSICVDGVLFDADACDGEGNLYVPDDPPPCPICQKRACIRWWREHGNKHAKALVEDIRRNRGLKP